MAAKTVLSEIRSLLEKHFKANYLVPWSEIDFHISPLMKNVEKLLKADQEKHAALMAHLQKFPDVHEYQYRVKVHDWKEELDKRTGTPENYVSFERQKLWKFYDWLHKHTELDRQSGYPISKERKEILKILEELLQPSGEGS